MSGLLIVKSLLEQTASLTLMDSQAEELWGECRAHLESIGMNDTVKDVELATGTVIDTLTRDDMLDAIAKVIAGMSWPCNGSSPEYRQQFSQALDNGIHQRWHGLSLQRH